MDLDFSYTTRDSRTRSVAVCWIHVSDKAALPDGLGDLSRPWCLGICRLVSRTFCQVVAPSAYRELVRAARPVDVSYRHFGDISLRAVLLLLLQRTPEGTWL